MKPFPREGMPLPFFLALALSATVAIVLLSSYLGCYNGDPPCNPGSVDYPRCDPTQPNWGARPDGGQG